MKYFKVREHVFSLCIFRSNLDTKSVKLGDDMLTPTGYPPPNTAAGTAHRTHSTQPALPPHRATPRVEDNTPVDAPALIGTAEFVGATLP